MKNTKRREFIKTSFCLSATAMLWPREVFSQTGKDPLNFQPLNHLSLTDFADAQEESPVLFRNRRQSWLVSLRRMFYPQDKELISLFQLHNGKWQEMSPVTVEPGQFEAVAADCSPDGEPAVVWSEIRGQQWLIRASLWRNGAFQPASTLNNPNQRAINPLVKAVGATDHLVAWEQFSEGKFSIWLARSQNGQWSQPVRITDVNACCFEPALEVGKTGDIYLSYSCTDGPHRNIQMLILDAKTLKPTDSVPIAIGGGLANRVNINAQSSLAFDREGRLWISWENNRFTTRLEDGDNYTGDRTCAMVCYHGGKLWEQKQVGRWLFKGKNDHLPTFHKDPSGNLYVLTHCGGDMSKNLFWSFRISRLDSATGWQEPITLLKTRQKGEQLRPSIIFSDDKKSFWMAWKHEEITLVNELGKATEQHGTEECNCCQTVLTPVTEPNKTAGKRSEQIRARRGKLEMEQFAVADVVVAKPAYELVETVVEEHHPVSDFYPTISGRPRIPRRQITYKGETYTLLVGNLHEHSENSNCWPAGTDGTLHDDIRFGLFSEGYDFGGITDHGYSLNEVYFRKSLRMAEFYNDSDFFVALPSFEYTLSNGSTFEIKRGVGHRNIFFANTEEARKFIRNRDEIYCVNSPEIHGAEKLWAFIHRHKVDCVAIPHHPADEVHACDWETHDAKIEPVVEIFQCRGNAEYRGAPRMINVTRHRPTDNDKGFIDYALRDKGYRIGFVASGDHSSMGVGLACVWVKEVSRKGLLEGLRQRRCFGTTGDKIFVDFSLNGAWAGEETSVQGAPKINYNVVAVDEITSIDILRNSRVIHSIKPVSGAKTAMGEWIDDGFKQETGGLYYYLRVSQKNLHLAWSSPIWVSV